MQRSSDCEHVRLEYPSWGRDRRPWRHPYCGRVLEQLELAGLGQADVDRWLTTHPTLHRSTGAFIRWLVTRRITGVITIPVRRAGLPSRFLSEQHHHDQLKRCLNDDTLPLAVRITGALVGLYALPRTRPISEGQLQASMRRHGLEIISARYTAMLEAMADLPPIVVSDLFSISARTAYRSAQHAQASLIDDLAANDGE